MNKEVVEKIFIEEQFNDALDTFLSKGVISEEKYDYYMSLFYNENVDFDYVKEDFLENIIDRIC